MSKERLGFDIEREMKHLKKIVNKEDSLTISSRFVKYLIEQAERVQELETVIEQDKRQSVLEGLYEQNKRYREAREIIEQVYKESYVRNAYGYEDGYLDGLDTAINIIDEALEE